MNCTLKHKKCTPARWNEITVNVSALTLPRALRDRRGCMACGWYVYQHMVGSSKSPLTVMTISMLLRERSRITVISEQHLTVGF